MRFGLKTTRISVRSRLTMGLLSAIVFSWMLGLVSFRYFLEQDIQRFNREDAARHARGHFRLVGPMGRLTYIPPPETPGAPPPGWPAPGQGSAAAGKAAPEQGGHASGAPSTPAQQPGMRDGGPPPGEPYGGPGGPGGPGRGPGPHLLPRPVSLSMVAQGIAGVLLALLTGWWLSRTYTRPLSALADGARAFHHREFTHRIPVRGNDEFADVATSMNEMAEEVGAQITALEQDAHRRRQVLADVAHELRSPVATLEAMTAALQDGVADEPGRRAEALAFMRDSASRMRRLVNDLLEVARLDLREIPLICAPVDLREAAADTVDSHRIPAERAGLRLLPVAAGEPVMVEADALRLSQVLDNLVENAISYAGAAAEVRIEVCPDPPRIIVADTGVGIAARHLPFIFDPFYRADVARTPGDNHSGLGLRIARGLIEAHGGTLTLESEEGRGTRATITFPTTVAA